MVSFLFVYISKMFLQILMTVPTDSVLSAQPDPCTYSLKVRFTH